APVPRGRRRRRVPGGRTLTLPDRLVEHLRGWVGAWPPERHLHVVANPRNAAPGWDGRVTPVTGVETDRGPAVIGVAPALAPPVAAYAQDADLDALLPALPGLLGRRGVAGRGVLRGSVAPGPLAAAG